MDVSSFQNSIGNFLIVTINAYGIAIEYWLEGFDG